MEKKAIIILDKGLKDSSGPDALCCNLAFMPLRK
jgi:hypothetical protein